MRIYMPTRIPALLTATACLMMTLSAPAQVWASAQPTADQAPAVQCMKPGTQWPASWYEPFPAHQIIGPLYAVGGVDLSVFLITSDQGHILINTALADSTAFIKNNVEALGFNFSDIRVILTTQAHFDHTAAMQEIKTLTGAQVWATPADAQVLEDGGASDAHFGNCIEFRFAPVTVERILTDGEILHIGGQRIQVHFHPGHTAGSASYSLKVTEGDETYDVLIANMGTINPGKKMLHEPTYPGVAEDFAQTFHRQKNLAVDVWVAAHASQYQRDQKYSAGQPYAPGTFVDPEGFKQEVERLEKIYLQQLKTERDEMKP